MRNTKTYHAISAPMLALLALLLFGATTITAAPGDLDPTFGIGGRLIDGGGFAHDVAVQSDGKIVVVGGQDRARGVPQRQDRVGVFLQVVDLVLQPLRLDVERQRLAGLDAELVVIDVFRLLDGAADRRRGCRTPRPGQQTAAAGGNGPEKRPGPLLMRLGPGHGTLVADITRCVVEDRVRFGTHDLRPLSAANLTAAARRLRRCSGRPCRPAALLPRQRRPWPVTSRTL